MNPARPWKARCFLSSGTRKSGSFPQILLTLLCVGHASTLASAEPDPGRFIATLPERYEMARLAGAWPGLYRMIRDIHASLGTPLVSNGLFYVGPLLDAIDRQAARENIAGVTGEIKDLVTLGPDGGYVYTWVYWIPGTRDLPTANVHVCYEAVGSPRGAGFITPAGEFIRAGLPENSRSCAGLIAATHP